MKNKEKVTNTEALTIFTNILAKEKNLSAAIAAIKSLLIVLEKSNCKLTIFTLIL